MGLDALASRVRPAVSVPLAALVVALVLTTHYEESDRSDNWVADRYGRDILADLPEGAILITEGDDAAFVLDYLLRIEGLRPDVTLYNRMGRGTDVLGWSEQALPQLRRERLRWRREAALAQSGRPLFYFVPRRSPLAEWVFVPAGLVYRLQAPDDNTGVGPADRDGQCVGHGLFPRPVGAKDPEQLLFYGRRGAPVGWGSGRGYGRVRASGDYCFRLAHHAL